MLFYGPKKADFVLLGLSEGSVTPKISLMLIRDTAGGPPSCVVLWDPKNDCFMAFLRKNFQHFGLVLFFGALFFRKNLPKFRPCFGIVSTIQCFPLQNGFKLNDFGGV